MTISCTMMVMVVAMVVGLGITCTSMMPMMMNNATTTATMATATPTPTPPKQVVDWHWQGSRGAWVRMGMGTRTHLGAVAGVAAAAVVGCSRHQGRGQERTQ